MTKDNIVKICEQYNIINYEINPDMIIDVDNDVKLSFKKLTNLPLKFGNVTGYFNCSNNNLTSLEGCPLYVGGGFYCSSNLFTSLECCPNYVGCDFICSFNNLRILKDGPTFIGGDFHFTRPITPINNNIIPINRMSVFSLSIGGKIHSNILWKF